MIFYNCYITGVCPENSRKDVEELLSRLSDLPPLDIPINITDLKGKKKQCFIRLFFKRYTSV